jgi:hypothetical protein
LHLSLSEEEEEEEEYKWPYLQIVIKERSMWGRIIY